MLPTIVLPKANADIDTFFLNIARDNIAVADQFLDRTEETLKLIAEFPKIAPRFITEHPKLLGIRWFPVKSFPKHLVFYFEDDTQITVVRMFHRAQDISAALE